MPTGREETTLGEVVDLIIDHRGKTPKKLWGDWSNSWYRAISAKSIKNWTLVNENKMNLLSDELYKKRMKEEIQKWDVLLTSEAPLGEHIIWNSEEKIVLSQRIFGIRTNKYKLYPHFFNYFIDSAYYQHQLKSRESWSTVTWIKQSELLKTQIILPPLPEQKAIAELLSSFDDKIELLREENKTLESLGQTLFRERFGKYTIDDPLPEWWSVGRLEEIIENYDSKRIPIAKDKRNSWIYPYYWATGINHYVKDFIFDDIYVLLGEDWSVMKENWKPFTQYVWWKIRVNNHAHVLQGKAWFSTEMIKIILDNTNIAPYISWAVQLKITQSNMNSIPVIIPTQKILKEFNAIIHPMFNKISNNTEQIQSLSHTRDTLLPKLMSGEVRVEM